MKLAILDDYQNCALALTDWSRIKGVEITVFNDTLPHTDPPNQDLIKRLLPFELISSMRERTKFNRAVLKELPNLKLLCTTGMRNAAIDMNAAAELGIVVCGTGILGDPTTELTWALILGLVRHIPKEYDNMKKGLWQTTLGFALRNKTIGLVGLGNLGKATARVAQAFNMKVIAWSPNLTEQRCQEAGVGFVKSKQELLKTADLVSIHMVLTDATRGMISAQDLALMKPTAYFINVSRGPLVDEEALADVLEKGAIAGAALDVYGTEPLESDHRFRKLDNVLLSPHLVSARQMFC
jgi:phosphoglycerate dehydrogenase-like enzyme